MNNLNDEQLNRLYDRIEQLEKENEKLKEGNHAHWSFVLTGYSSSRWARIKCSRCGYEIDVGTWYFPNYCEHCGAKMDEEKDSNHD